MSVSHVRPQGVTPSGAPTMPRSSAAVARLPTPPAMDPYAALYALTVNQRSQNAETAKSATTTNRAQAREELDRVEHELQKQKEAEESKTFWDVLGDALSVVTIVATTVGSLATGGALAVASCALSAASFAQNEFHVLEELGVDAEIAAGIGIGCGVLGVAAGVGAALEGVKKLSAVEAKLATASKLIEGGSTTGSAVTRLGSELESRHAATAYARSEVHAAEVRHIERTQDRLVKTLGETAKSYERALGTLVEIVSEQARCRETIAQSLA